MNASADRNNAKKPKKEIVVTLAVLLSLSLLAVLLFCAGRRGISAPTQPDTSTAAVGRTDGLFLLFPGYRLFPVRRSDGAVPSFFRRLRRLRLLYRRPYRNDDFLPGRRLTQNGRRADHRPADRQAAAHRRSQGSRLPGGSRGIRRRIADREARPIKALRRSIPGGWRKLLWNGTTGNNG